MRDKVAEALCEREEEMRTERANWENLWQNVAKYVLPNDATFIEKLPGGLERTRWILDSTAPRSLELFASAMHGLLNNPALRWVKIGVEGDPAIMEVPENRAWATDVEDRILNALAGEEADIYSQLHTVYLGLGSVGTSCLFEDVSRAGNLRVREYHMSDVVVDEGESEMVDTVMRRWRTTIRRARQRWPGLELGKSVDDGPGGQRKKPGEVVEFMHVVVPASDPVVQDIPARWRNLRAPYYSCWVNRTDRKTVKYDTYEEFPYMVPRWYKTRGEVYGRSPAMTALPDIRMVNQMSATILRGAEKIVDPPLVIPDGGLVSPARLFPGGITYSEGTVEIKTLIPPGTSRIETGNQLLEQRQQAIREAFFTPLFATPESPVKTATQVLQEVDERNRAVSPMLVRVQSELFNGLIRRTYNLLLRAGRIPAAPPDLVGPKLKVEYVSPLIASQRQMEALSTIRLFEMMAPWMGLDRGIGDWVDSDQLFPVILTGSGAPAKIAKSVSKVKELRAVRNQQVEAAQAAELGLKGGEVAAKLGLAQAALQSQG